MQRTNLKYYLIGLALLELVLGIILGRVFIQFERNSSLIISTYDSYFWGIFKFYGLLSILFFLLVFGIGIPGAILLGLAHKIKPAIKYSCLAFFISILLLPWFTSLLKVFSIYFVLLGIILGYNLGLFMKEKVT